MSHQTRGGAAVPRVLDIHAHLLSPEVYERTRAHSLFARMAEDADAPEEQRRALRARAERVEHNMAEAEERVARMDAMGVGIQVLSASLVHQSTDFADPDTALALERRHNDRLAGIVAARPDRFLGLGGVPLQAPALAVAELERCMGALRLHGVGISTRAGGREIGDPALHPFWAKAAELGAVVYVHPAGNQDERLRKFQLWNSLGQSMEEAFAIASLIYEGVLERFPGLKICIAHGGGYMPYNTGRVDRNYEEKPATRVNMRRPPAEYLRMLSYDTCVYDGRTLEALVAKVGAERVILGSDYPVGEMRPVEFVTSAPGLSAEQKGRILWNNAAALFGLPGAAEGGSGAPPPA
ncbi:amidohydrolase family protein [Roseomonas sp. BN140053]|uniref:amidohydrolase family protein n=1 Tax=Roseomonas sp. BN140053 TaxID=3391898 RepID=UPI0039E8ED59